MFGEGNLDEMINKKTLVLEHNYLLVVLRTLKIEALLL